MKVPVGRWPEAALTLARTFGVRGAWLRGTHEMRRRGGRFREAPLHPAPVLPPAEGGAFHVDAARLAAVVDIGAALERAERVASGAHPAYRWEWRPLPATAAEWHTHPVTGGRFDDGPWWRLSHLDATVGDIKDIWEPARFAWVYDLVRAWLLTGDERWVRAFEAHFDEWRRSSPPFRGVHWSCGQETAIRAEALLFAEANLPQSDQRSAALREALAASGERIADAIGYAVSQRNNHALSEATGLVLLGARFSGAHPEADGWLAQGRKWLETLIPEQFAEDGWYIQHSFTYQRLALEQCVLAQRALAARGEALSPRAVERLRASTRLLLRVMHPPTGRVPNHGANDGAFVLPTTLAPFGDFRPVLTAACATFGEPLPTNVVADAEVLAWLGAAAPEPAPPLGDGAWSGASGWAAVRTGPMAVFLRAGRYRSRPGHMDALHLDVRCDGADLVVDPGTFAYNAPPPWRNPLTAAGFHNGPVVDGQEPGVRGPRFLWYLWPRAELTPPRRDGDGWVLEGTVPGRVTRRVRVSPHGVRVRDQVLDDAAQRLEVRWTLHPETPDGVVRMERASVHSAREGDPAGWFSPHYGERVPSRVVAWRADRPAELRAETFIAPPGSRGE